MAVRVLSDRRLLTALSAVLVLAPVLFVRGHADVRVGLAPVYGYKLALASAAALALSALAALHAPTTTLPRFVRLSAIALVAAYVVGAVASTAPQLALPTAMGRSVLVLCFVALAGRAAPTLRSLAHIALGVGALLSAMALLEILGVRWSAPVETVPAVTLVHRNNVAFHLAAALPFAVAALLAAGGRRALALAVGLVVLVGCALVASRSRGAWAAALAGCGFVLVVGRRHARGWLLAGVAVVALAAAAAAERRDLEPLTTRVETLFDRDSDAVRDRLHLYRITVAEIAARPLVGWGAGLFPVEHPRFFDRFATADHPHDDLLTAAWEAGLPAGAALAVLLVGTAARIVRRAWRERSIAIAGLAGSLLAWLVLGVANSPLALAPSAAQLWLTLAVAVRYGALQKESS